MKKRKNKNYFFRGLIVGVLITASVSCFVKPGSADAKFEPLTVTTQPMTVTATPIAVNLDTSESEPKINEYDLDVLARVIYGEAGASWCDDKMRYYVGSVVLNRVANNDFPNTIRDVVFQKGQYACTWAGNYYDEPTERCYEIAEWLLLNGSVLPEGVVYQAEFIQGSGIYEKVQNQYFCYK